MFSGRINGWMGAFEVLKDLLPFSSPPGEVNLSVPLQRQPLHTPTIHCDHV